MKLRLFLTGRRQSGKTSLLIRALSDLRPISGGYAVVDLVDGEAHLPALLPPCEAAADHLPAAMFPGADYNRAAFLSRYPALLQDIRDRGLGYLDPLLGDELSDAALTADLEVLLQSGTPLAGVLCAPEDSGNPETYVRLLSLLEEDEDTLLLNVDTLSETEAVSAMRQWAEAVLDKAHHEKFDPLMKLRARRKRPEFPPDYQPQH